MSVNRCYSEKKPGFDVEARSLFSSLHDLLEIKSLTHVRYLCRYDTGFGALTVGVFTQSLHSDLGAAGGRLSVQYTLDVNASLASTNEIHITVKEAGRSAARQP